MDITLTPAAAAVVQQKLANGKFASADEVVEAAVMLLDERDRYRYLRSLLLEAEQEVQEGKVVEWTPELHRQWRREAQERMHEDYPLDPDVCP
jgi:putative addiction module CopG family antidote